MLADTPAAYYRMDEASGLIQDSSGNGNHATATLGAGSATYGETGALASEPTSDSIRLTPDFGFSVPDHATLDVGDSFTIEAWIKLNAINTAYGIATKGDTNGWAFRVTSSNKLLLSHPSVADVRFSLTSLSAGVFYHVVAVKDGATRLIYLNGVDDTDTASGSASTHTDNNQALFVGSYGGFQDFLNGWIDEVAIYDSALSQARILAHYQAAFAEVGRRYKRLVGPQQLSTSEATLYTVPVGTRTRVRNLHLSNPGASAVDVTLGIGSVLYFEHPVAAGDVYSARRPIEVTLAAGQIIRGFASNTGVVVVIDGVRRRSELPLAVVVLSASRAKM